METETKSKKNLKMNYQDWLKEYCAEKGLEPNMEVRQIYLSYSIHSLSLVTLITKSPTPIYARILLTDSSHLLRLSKKKKPKKLTRVLTHSPTHSLT
jgi:hypothetical protein